MTSQFYVEILEVNVFKISLSCKLNVIKKNRVDTTSNKKNCSATKYSVHSMRNL